MLNQAKVFQTLADHGIRFFTNLLPTYIDPAKDGKIYTSGITLFL